MTTVYPPIIYPGVTLGALSRIEPFVVLGSPDGTPLVIGKNALIRSGTRIYGGVTIGDSFETGHNSLIRGNVRIGDRCKLGSLSSIEGNTVIGDDTVIRGKVEIPSGRVGSRVQIYAYATFYDTPHPPDGPCLPPTIEDDVVLCCGARVLGGVTVGRGSFIGADVFVNQNIPANSYVTAVRECRIRPRR